jgi:hypothetical protein
MEFKNDFSLNIFFDDDSGIWQGVWNNIKEQLSLHFVSIKYKERMNYNKTLSNLNIKMVQRNEENLKLEKLQNSIKNSQLNSQDENKLPQSSFTHLYVTKINSVNDLKNGGKEKFLSNLDKFKSSMHVILMDIENSDSGYKSAIKSFDKIKSELKNQELKLLPVTPCLGKISELISEFFVTLKVKISNEINKVLFINIKQIENFKNQKSENKDIDSIYNYLQHKENLFSYLHLFEFYDEILKLCEEDLFLNFNQMKNSEISFSEPYSYLDFDENLIRNKISDKSLINLEYQQFLFFQIFKCCKLMRDFRKLNFYTNKILNEINNLKPNFISKYHFSFWSYQFTCRLSPYLKSLKSNIFSTSDEEVNIRTQILVMNHMKRSLKNLALLLKFEIANLKLISNLLDRKLKLNEDEDIHYYRKNSNSHTLDSLLILYNERDYKILENDQNFNSFIKDINLYLDDKSRFLLTDKLKLNEEFLNILNNLENLHLKLKQKKMAIKVQIEKLPIMLLLNKNSSIPEILLELIKTLKKERWDFLFEFLNYILIIIITCNSSSSSEENLKIILEFLNIKFKRYKELDELFEIKRENALNNILCEFIHSVKIEKLKEVKFELSNLFDVKLSREDEQQDGKYLYPIDINLNKVSSDKFKLSVKNESKLKFCLSKIIFCFINLEQIQDNQEEILQEHLFDENFIIDEEMSFNQLIEFNYKEISETIQNNQPHNFSLRLNKIKFILANGVEGIYNIKFLNGEYSISDGLIINIKQNNFEVKSSIKGILPTNNPNTQIQKNMFFYNTIYPLTIQLKSLDDFDFNGKSLRILTESHQTENSNYSDESIFKIISDKINIKNSEGENLNVFYQDKIYIQDNKILVSDEINFKHDNLLIEVYFYIEDNDFYKSTDKKIEIKTEISKGDKNIFEVFCRDIHYLNFQHIFTLTHKTRKEKENNILIQTSINLNLNLKGVNIYSNHNSKSEIDIHQTLNLIKIINKDNLLRRSLTNLNFKYSLDVEDFTFIYPEESLIDQLRKILKNPFHIKISIQNLSDDHSDGVQLFQEFNLKINVKKYVKEDVLIMIKVKENDNWSVVGKCRLIEKISSNDNNSELEFIEVSKIFKLIPMQDGYVKLPQIDFMEFKINPFNINDLKNINSLEFLPIQEGTIIEGNEKIVKVYSINSCALRLNYL